MKAVLKNTGKLDLRQTKTIKQIKQTGITMSVCSDYDRNFASRALLALDIDNDLIQ